MARPSQAKRKSAVAPQNLSAGLPRAENEYHAPPKIIRLTNAISPTPPRQVRWRTDTTFIRRSAPRRWPRLLLLLGALLIFAFFIIRLPGWISGLFTGPSLSVPSTLATRHDFAAFFPVPAPRTKGKISHDVASGENWQVVMRRYGFGGEVAAQIEDEIANSINPQVAKFALHRGETIDLTVDDTGLSRVRVLLSAKEELVFKPDLSSHFRLKVQKLTQVSQERVLLGEISRQARSFSQAAQEAGVSYDVVDDLVDLFSDKINFRRDFRVGDRFTVIFKEEMIGDGSTFTPGPILAAALSVNGSRFVAIRYVGSDGQVRYFDERGHSADNSFLRYPLKFSRISSEFTYARFHPVLKIKRPHNGGDFAAPTGTPVRAVANGIVEIASNRGGSGNMVQLRHSERYQTGYLHLSKISPGLKIGARVKRGDVIGAVGSTGLATGPHLHFSFLDNGVYTNPLKTSLPTIDELGKEQQINATYLARALFTLERYQEMNLIHLGAK